MVGLRRDEREMYYRRTRCYIYIYRAGARGIISQVKTGRKIENEDEKRRIKGTIPFLLVSVAIYSGAHLDVIARQKDLAPLLLFLSFLLLLFLFLLLLVVARSAVVGPSVDQNVLLSVSDSIVLRLV